MQNEILAREYLYVHLFIHLLYAAWMRVVKALNIFP